MPVAALVLGIIGTLLCWHPMLVLVGLPTALVAMVLGIMARKQLAAQGQPTGMATAGMVLGIVGTTIGGLILAACVACAACFGAAGSQMSKAIEKAAQEAKQENDNAAKKALEAPAPPEEPAAVPAPEPPPPAPVPHHKHKT